MSNDGYNNPPYCGEETKTRAEPNKNPKNKLIIGIIAATIVLSIIASIPT